MDLEDNNTLLLAGSASASEKLSCSSSKQHPCVHGRFKRGPERDARTREYPRAIRFCHRSTIFAGKAAAGTGTKCRRRSRSRASSPANDGYCREITLARTKRNHGLSWFQRHEPVGEEAHGDRRRAGR